MNGNSHHSPLISTRAYVQQESQPLLAFIGCWQAMTAAGRKYSRGSKVESAKNIAHQGVKLSGSAHVTTPVLHRRGASLSRNCGGNHHNPVGYSGVLGSRRSLIMGTKHAGDGDERMDGRTDGRTDGWTDGQACHTTARNTTTTSR